LIITRITGIGSTLFRQLNIFLDKSKHRNSSALILMPTSYYCCLFCFCCTLVLSCRAVKLIELRLIVL